MDVEIDKFFTPECQSKIMLRLAEKSIKKPSIYTSATCEAKTLKIFPDYPRQSFSIEWGNATDIIITCDLICLFVYYLSVRCLKSYENIHLIDRKEKLTKIEDYTVYVKKIPISEKLYNS